MERADVTAIVPCFKASATLERALSSVAAQTRLPVETLLVDDGNPQDEATRLDELAARFPNICCRVIRLPVNRGAGSARNAAWAQAQSSFLAFLDADDAWHPRKLELQTAVLAARPDAALCGHPVRVLASGEQLPEEPCGTAALQGIARWPLLLVNPLATPTWMVRRSETVRFTEGKRYVEDHLLLMELALRRRVLVRLDLELTALFKPSLSRSGLSSEVWAMERGELDAYARIRAQGLIGAASWAGLSGLSLVKFVRRVVVVGLLR